MWLVVLFGFAFLIAVACLFITTMFYFIALLSEWIGKKIDPDYKLGLEYAVKCSVGAVFISFLFIWIFDKIY